MFGWLFRTTNDVPKTLIVVVVGVIVVVGDVVVGVAVGVEVSIVVGVVSFTVCGVGGWGGVVEEEEAWTGGLDAGEDACTHTRLEENRGSHPA